MTETPTEDRIGKVRLAASVFEVAAERLEVNKGLTSSEVGRAMLAIAVARLVHSLPAQEVMDQLAALAADVAASSGIDLGEGELPSTP